jgi:hypothetical protein
MKSKTWKIGSAIRYRRLFDEGVLIHQASARALVLNETALRFIEGCDGEKSTGEIIAEMVEEFEVTPGQLQQDLEPFIEQLAEEGIIELV